MPSENRTKELIDNGELMDLFYYKSALDPMLARTYFRQCIFDLENFHNTGIVHGHIKPEYLLFDAQFNIHIDFSSDRYNKRVTKYEAPELISDCIGRKFENNAIFNLFICGYYRWDRVDYGNIHRVLSFIPIEIAQICFIYYGAIDYRPCDIFSMGIILFILLSGYLPFEGAVSTDCWFRQLIKRNFNKFWKYHSQYTNSIDTICKSLLQDMLCADHKQRITIPQIKQHPWFTAKYLSREQLTRALKDTHRKMRDKMISNRNRYCSDLSLRRNRNIEITVSEWMYSSLEDVLSYSYIHGNANDFLSYVTDLIIKIYHGEIMYECGNGTMFCAIRMIQKSRTQKDSKPMHQKYEFTIALFKSKEYSDSLAKQCGLLQYEKVYVVVIRRIKGDAFKFCELRSKLLQEREIFNGLPDWAAFRFFDRLEL